MGKRFSALMAWVAVIAVMVAFLVVMLYGLVVAARGA